VHDSGPVGVAAGDRVGQEALDERAALVPRRRMDDHSGGLVHDEEMLVLVRDPQRQLLCLEGRRGRRGRLELEGLPAAQPVALGTDGAVDADAALAQQPLGARS
jgi:hypothetical protein